MKSSPEKPVWWALDLIFMLMLGLMVLSIWLPLSPAGHNWALLSVMVGGFSLVAFWIYGNRAPLSESSYEDRWDRPPLHWTVYRKIENSLPQSGTEDEASDDEEISEWL